MHPARTAIVSLLSGFGLALGVHAAPVAAAECASRGDLDARYCDADGDLLADKPADKSRQKDPATLFFSYTPVEDPAVYENVFSEFIEHLSKVTG